MTGHGLSASKTVARNALYNAAGYGVAIAYVILIVPVVVGYVGMEQFGLWSLVVAITGYIGLADLGVVTSFVKFVSEYHSRGEEEEVNSVVRHGLLFYLGVWVLFVLAGALLAPLVFPLVGIPLARQDLAWELLLLYLVAFGVSNLASVYTSVLTGFQRMDLLNMLQSLTLLVRFGAIVAALAMGTGLVGMVIAEIGIAVLSLIAGGVAARRCFPGLRLWPLRYDRAMMVRLLKFGSQLQVSRLTELVQGHFDKFVIGRFVGLAPVSLYDFGSRPLGRMRALAMVATNAMLPAVSALDAENNAARIRSALVRATRYIVLLSAPLFAFVALFPDELITVWLGEGYHVAALTLRILSFAYFVSTVVAPLGYVSQGKGEPKYQMQTALAQALVNIVLSLVLIQVYGYFGAVVGTLSATIIGGLLFIAVYGRRVLPGSFRMYASALLKPLLSLLPGAVAGRLLLDALVAIPGGSSRLVLLFHLGLAGALLCALYVVSLLLLRTFGADDKGFLLNVLPGRFQKYVHRLKAD